VCPLNASYLFTVFLLCSAATPAQPLTGGGQYVETIYKQYKQFSLYMVQRAGHMLPQVSRSISSSSIPAGVLPYATGFKFPLDRCIFLLRDCFVG